MTKHIYLVVFYLILLVGIGACTPPIQSPVQTHNEKIRDLKADGLKHYNKKQYPESLQRYQAALTIAKTIGNKASQANIHYDMGYVYLKLLNFPAALHAFQLSLENIKPTSEVRQAGDIHNMIGRVYQELGNLKKAQYHLEQSLHLSRQAKDKKGEAIASENLATSFFYAGQYLKAIKLYEDAATWYIANQSTQPYASTQSSLGIVYAEMGQYKKALSLQRKAYQTYKKIPDVQGISTVWHNIGFIRYQQKDYCGAVTAFEEALKVRKKEGDQLSRAETLNGLALPLSECHQQYTKALQYLFQVKEIQSRLGAKDQLAATLDSIGAVYHKQGKYDEALTAYHESLSLFLSHNNREKARITLGNIAITLQQKGQTKLAIVFLKLAVNTTQAIRNELRQLPKTNQRAYLNRVEDHFRLLAELLIDSGRLAEAEQVLTMLKEEEYFDFINRRSDKSSAVKTTIGFNTAEMTWRQHFDSISHKIVIIGKQYEALKSRKKQGFTPQEKIQFEQLKKDRKVANKAFRIALEELEEEKEKSTEHIKPLATQHSLKSLGSGEVFIHFLISDKKLSLMLTTPEIRLRRISHISKKDLNHLITDFRKLLTDPHSNPLPAAQKLYKYLLSPLEKDLHDANAKTLFLSLDGALRYLPFAALHDGKQYLMERYGLITYNAAAQTNLTLKPQASWRVAGLGVTKTSNKDFSPLPAVRRELDAIIKEKGDKDLLGVLPGIVAINQKFTADKLADVLQEDFPVIHIASHFKFNPGTALDSFLLLGTGEKLTLADLQDGDYPLAEVDLLTLSACETAYGDRDARGREVESFGTIAMRQGAKAVLATLWSVVDESTANFMANFYQHREQVVTKTKALQLSQLQFLLGGDKTGMSKGDLVSRGIKINSPIKPDAVVSTTLSSVKGLPYAHPYYWAPFILMGNGL